MDYKEVTQIAVNALENVKGQDIIVIDTSDLSPLFNSVIVCSGNSNRQLSALANNVVSDFKEHGINVVGTEGDKGGEWILVDCGDVIVHIMLPNVRSYYDLETLWNGSSTV